MSGPAELIDLEAEVTVARERACWHARELAGGRLARLVSLQIAHSEEG